MKTNINSEQLQNWNEQFVKNQTALFFQDTLVNNSIKESTINRDTKLKSRTLFSTEIKTGQIRAQKQSERCWLFSALNMLRVKTIQEMNLSSQFAFSVNYLCFYDKLEKANFFLENVLRTGEDIFTSEYGKSLLRHPIQEGGQWFMFCNLLHKYGVVPEEVMPETHHSTDSTELNRYINRILRNAACELLSCIRRGADQIQLSEKKEEFLTCVYTVLCCTLGTPPQQFTYDYYDKDHNYQLLEEMTPQKFADKFILQNPDDYVCIVNAPGQNRRFGEVYTVDHFGNMEGGQTSLYYNLEMYKIKPLLIKQLKDGESIWFGCDCLNMMDRPNGIMSAHIYDSDTIFGVNYQMSKADLLDYCESSPNHDMVITGYKEMPDSSFGWKVENSWGETSGQNGYYFMDDSYLDDYAFQFMIHKKHLSQEQLADLKKEPVVLKFDDPLGA